MTWNDYYNLAIEYYRRHGTIDTPSICWFGGVNIGAWLMRQRVCHLPDAPHPLDTHQVELLDELHMGWEIRCRDWEVCFGCAERYFAEHGNLTVPKNYETDGVNLSHWIWAQRRIMLGTDPDRKQQLTEEQVHRLESIGMEWAPKSKGFGYYYDQAKKFYDAYGHTDFPEGEVYVEGERLPESGESLLQWKCEQEQYLRNYKQQAYGTFASRRKLLYEIGINPTNWEIPWEKNYRHAAVYFQTNGNLLVPFYYKTEDGIALGKWISQQRLKKKGTKGTLSANQIRRLEEIGMVWDTGGKRTKRKDARAAKDAKDTGTVKTAKDAGTATTVKEDKIRISTAWEHSFAVAEAYYKEHGDLFVPTDYVADGVKLNYWLRTQRRIRYGKLANRKSPLTEEQIRRLDSIGMPWQPGDARWERSFAIAEKYYKAQGNLKPPKDYEEDGVNLSHWIWAQRRMYFRTDADTGKKLTENQIRRLESIGMEWTPKSKGFSYYCEMAKQYYDANGNTDFPAGNVEVDGEVLPESGEMLTAWKERMQCEFANKKYDMKWEQITSLREIGILSAETSSPWEKNYRAAEEYYRRNGNLRVPFSYITDDGIRLGRWISTQRMKRSGTASGKLSEEQIRRLDAIGMVWSVQKF